MKTQLTVFTGKQMQPKLKRQVWQRSHLKDYTADLISQILLVLGTNVLLSNSGYGIGVTSSMLSQLYEENLLDEAMASWFASSLVLGQIIGSLFGAWLANTVGRKKACIGSIHQHTTINKEIWYWLSEEHSNGCIESFCSCTKKQQGNKLSQY